MPSPGAILVTSLSALGLNLRGVAVHQDAFGKKERYLLRKQHVAEMARLNAAYLRACGVKIRKVDLRTGYIEARKTGSVANINFAYQRECVSPYIADNEPLLNTSTPSSSVTSCWSGRE